MKTIRDLVGQRFGRLIVTGRATNTPAGSRMKAAWFCKCDCGKNIIVLSVNITYNNTRSCGCLQRELAAQKKTTHGLSKTRLYEIWGGMRKRCENTKTRAYKNYGGRGITVCREWLDFTVFYEWAVSNGYKDNLAIERINNNGDYCPENCTWATPKEQARNMRTNRLLTYNGKTLCINEWAETLSIQKGTLWNRIKLGWTTEKALTQPVRRVA